MNSEEMKFEEMKGNSPLRLLKSYSCKSKDDGKCSSDKVRRRNLKNPYISILDQLPQEIRDKIDSSKENLEDM